MEVPLPDFQNVLFEPRDHLLYVTLNRPERRNAIDPQTSYELLQVFTAFKEDDDLWVAIVTGAGDQAFSAGADLVAMAAAFAGGTQTEFMKAPFAGITRGFEAAAPVRLHQYHGGKVFPARLWRPAIHPFAQRFARRL